MPQGPGRRAINLDPYKDEILSLYTSRTTVTSILTLLYKKYNIQISKRTLESRLQSWDIQYQNRTLISDPLLHARIRVLFFQVGLEEKELLSVLQTEGYSLSSRTLQYIRTKLGLKRRVRDPIQAQLQREQILEVLQAEAEKRLIQAYGKEMLHRYIRGQGFIIERYTNLYSSRTIANLFILL